MRFDELVGGVIENNCKSCHNPESKNIAAAKFDLTELKAYETLVNYGKPSLKDTASQEIRTTSRASNAKSVAGCGSLFPANSIKSNDFFDARLGIDSILYNIAMTSRFEDV